jgi:hypothetical protein
MVEDLVIHMGNIRCWDLRGLEDNVPENSPGEDLNRFPVWFHIYSQMIMSFARARQYDNVILIDDDRRGRGRHIQEARKKRELAGVRPPTSRSRASQSSFQPPHLLSRCHDHEYTTTTATTIMINAVLVFNNNGQPRLTKFYTQLVSLKTHHTLNLPIVA